MIKKCFPGGASQCTNGSCDSVVWETTFEGSKDRIIQKSRKRRHQSEGFIFRLNAVYWPQHLHNASKSGQEIAQDNWGNQWGGSLGDNLFWWAVEKSYIHRLISEFLLGYNFKQTFWSLSKTLKAVLRGCSISNIYHEGMRHCLNLCWNKLHAARLHLRLW